MSIVSEYNHHKVTGRLAESGYWPARAARLVDEGKFAAAVALCKDALVDQPDLLSGRVIYASALYRAGQITPAAEQFFYVLSLDPENIVALKMLGDIKSTEGDELAATTYYRRVLEIDPDCRGLVCPIETPAKETTRTITLHRPEEKQPATPPEKSRIPFYTETIGDLYLKQGHPRLAADVYRALHEQNETPRLAEKLSRAEKQSMHKER